MCSLRFKNNLLSSEGVRFASISKKTLLSKLSFAVVSLALPLLVGSFLLNFFVALIFPYCSLANLYIPILPLFQLHNVLIECRLRSGE